MANTPRWRTWGGGDEFPVARGCRCAACCLKRAIQTARLRRGCGGGGNCEAGGQGKHTIVLTCNKWSRTRPKGNFEETRESFPRQAQVREHTQSTHQRERQRMRHTGMERVPHCHRLRMRRTDFLAGEPVPGRLRQGDRGMRNQTITNSMTTTQHRGRKQMDVRIINTTRITLACTTRIIHPPAGAAPRTPYREGAGAGVPAPTKAPYRLPG